MHQGWAVGSVAFMILCFPVESVTAEEKKPANAIRVLEATYGGNCAGVGKGNVTKFIASACDGTDLCNYRVYYKNMGGDPAAGCKKAFRVTFVCGKNTKPETCGLEAEAGKGGEDGEDKQLLPFALFERRRALSSEGEIKSGWNSTCHRSRTTHGTTSHTKYPTTITTMAMALTLRCLSTRCCYHPTCTRTFCRIQFFLWQLPNQGNTRRYVREVGAS